MSGYVVAVLGACLILGFMVELLRRRRLREKYAALWIVVSVLVLATVALPDVLRRLADALGVTVPINLVFFGSLLLLLAVAIQLSAEVTSLEREAQALAEEIALIRYRLEKLEAAARDADPSGAVEDAAAVHRAEGFEGAAGAGHGGAMNDLGRAERPAS